MVRTCAQAGRTCEVARTPGAQPVCGEARGSGSARGGPAQDQCKHKARHATHACQVIRRLVFVRRRRAQQQRGEARGAGRRLRRRSVGSGRFRGRRRWPRCRCGCGTPDLRRRGRLHGRRGPAQRGHVHRHAAGHRGSGWGMRAQSATSACAAPDARRKARSRCGAPRTLPFARARALTRSSWRAAAAARAGAPRSVASARACGTCRAREHHCADHAPMASDAAPARATRCVLPPTEARVGCGAARGVCGCTAQGAAAMTWRRVHPRRARPSALRARARGCCACHVRPARPAAPACAPPAALAFELDSRGGACRAQPPAPRCASLIGRRTPLPRRGARGSRGKTPWLSRSTWRGAPRHLRRTLPSPPRPTPQRWLRRRCAGARMASHVAVHTHR